MLSIIDLLAARTVDAKLAGYLMHAVSCGASMVTCAVTAHADSLSELDQILTGPAIGMDRTTFAHINLVLFIKAMRVFGTGEMIRRVTSVYAGTGVNTPSHHRVCYWDSERDSFIWETTDDPAPLVGASASPELMQYEDFIKDLAERGIHDIDSVRREVVSFLGQRR